MDQRRSTGLWRVGGRRGWWKAISASVRLPLGTFRLGGFRAAYEFVGRLLAGGRIFGCACPVCAADLCWLGRHPLALVARAVDFGGLRRARRLDLRRLARDLRDHRSLGSRGDPSSASVWVGVGRAAAAAATTAASRRAAGCALRWWPERPGPESGCACAGGALGQLVSARLVDSGGIPRVARPPGTPSGRPARRGGSSRACGCRRVFRWRSASRHYGCVAVPEASEGPRVGLTQALNGAHRQPPSGGVPWRARTVAPAPTCCDSGWVRSSRCGG
jgi:hypothetical protein